MSKKLSKQQIRNAAIIGGVITVLVAVLVFVLFFSSDDNKANKPQSSKDYGKTNVQTVGTSAVAENTAIDPTQALNEMGDQGYAEQLRKVDEQRKQEALKTGDESYVQSVSTRNWETDGDARNPEDVNIDTSMFDLSSEAPSDPSNSPDNGAGEPSNTEQKPTQQSEQERVMSLADQARAAAKNSPTYQERAERVAREQAQQQAEQEATKQTADNNQRKRVRTLSPTGLESRIKDTRSALRTLENNIKEPSSFEVVEYAADSDDAENTSERSSYNQPNFDTQESVSGGTVRGFVPGDKLIGYTRLPIDTDSSTWVEVVIGLGPLTDAVVGLTPKRVGEEVIMESTTLTYKRHTDSFKAIALNPDLNLKQGFATEVDNRYWQKLGAASLSAMLATGTSLIREQTSTTSNASSGLFQTEKEYSDAEIIGASLAAAGAESGRILAEEARGIETQVTVKEGQRVVLVVTQAQPIDWLPEPYIIKQ